jgi:hypothetical protein
MPKLPKTQIAALALIEDNPRKVEAISRIAKGYKRIHGNAEHALTKLGLIEKVEVGTHTREAFGSTVTVTLNAWKLTPAGVDALHAATHAAV